MLPANKKLMINKWGPKNQFLVCRMREALHIPLNTANHDLLEEG